jgi:hypothetical protein
MVSLLSVVISCVFMGAGMCAVIVLAGPGEVNTGGAHKKTSPQAGFDEARATSAS